MKTHPSHLFICTSMTVHTQHKREETGAERGVTASKSRGRKDRMRAVGSAGDVAGSQPSREEGEQSYVQPRGQGILQDNNDEVCQCVKNGRKRFDLSFADWKPHVPNEGKINNSLKQCVLLSQVIEWRYLRAWCSFWEPLLLAKKSRSPLAPTMEKHNLFPAPPNT